MGRIGVAEDDSGVEITLKSLSEAALDLRCAVGERWVRWLISEGERERERVLTGERGTTVEDDKLARSLLDGEEDMRSVAAMAAAATELLRLLPFVLRSSCFEAAC